MKTSLTIILLSFAIILNAQKTSVPDKLKTFSFKAKLAEEADLPPDCGIIAWAVVQKFEVIETNYPNYNNKYVLIIEPCPEFKGKHFFQKGVIYQMTCSVKSGVPFSYMLFSDRYKKDNSTTFWSKKTERVND